MDLNLQGKVAVITGGAKGIGAAIVRAFAAEGAKVVIVNRPGKEGHALRRELEEQGCPALVIEAELTEPAECKRAVETAVEQYGRIDVLVNNAGCNDAKGLDCTPEEFMTSVRNNLIHYYAMLHYALPYLKETVGSVINIGSHVATHGQGNTSGYVAAKGGIHALTREWAVDLLPYGIRVNCVVPGNIMTNAYKKWIDCFSEEEGKRIVAELSGQTPLGHRFTLPEEFAATVVFLASERSSHTTGEVIHPDGGYTSLDRACTK